MGKSDTLSHQQGVHTHTHPVTLRNIPELSGDIDKVDDAGRNFIYLNRNEPPLPALPRFPPGKMLLLMAEFSCFLFPFAEINVSETTWTVGGGGVVGVV